MFANLDDISPDQPVLIAGATASGKSELALRIAEAQGGVILNADAIQVFADWRVLTARPPEEDLRRAAHHLYGHVPGNQPYSVGSWLKDVAPFLTGKQRPIIVGGTGLYFSALNQGLADIPATPTDVRATADQIIADQGHQVLLADLDADTLARIDQRNPMRVQRAWEVQQATGRGIAAWQDDTPPPLLPLADTVPLLLDGDRNWLNARIAARFDQMMDTGALDEARAHLDDWDPKAPSSKAIGASELIAYLRGELTRDAAVERATIATRQFAKRQRTWFRARMSNWRKLDPAER